MNNQYFDIFFRRLSQFFTFLILIVLISIIISLIFGSWDAIVKYKLNFFRNYDWNPVSNEFGALIPIIGTLITSFIALLISVPVSFGIAIFLTECCPIWLKRPIGTAIEMLAAIPSIVYGMWGLFVFAPIFQLHIQPTLIFFFSSFPLIGRFFYGPAIGIGVFTASLVLSIMIIPFISSIMKDIFEIVPKILKESVYGLGANTWEVVWKVILPFSRSGIIGGIMLGLSRALGETMAVTFVIGNAFRLPESIFSPTNSIASALANEFNEADGFQKSALMELGLVLFLITFIILVLAKIFLMHLSRTKKVIN